MAVPGYAGKFLRVDLSTAQFTEERLDEQILRKYVGGTGIGAKYLYEEVPPGIQWSDPNNRLIIASGPLGGTRVGGTGAFSVVTKGCLTNGATSTQANGFFGAYLKFSGFDGIIFQGASDNLVYLYLHDGVAELRDATQLAGKDTWETEELIKKELGKRKRELSVFSIGPAGENLVKFAAIVGDQGHVAAHNGVGAVMGSKRLKAVAAARGKGSIQVKDKERVSELAREMFETVISDPRSREYYEWGTSFGYNFLDTGVLPVKNYTTNLFPAEVKAKFMGQYTRAHFEIKRNPCWACRFKHCHLMKVTEGPYAGYEGEEPDYEQWASWGSLIGQTDPGAAVMLSNEVDCLGMDTNEAGWVMGLAMECYEKGIITKEDTDGLELTWGNVEAVRTMLHKIANRQGLGKVLSEGAMRAAQQIGGQAPFFAIHTMKGNTPRTHDHRPRWTEMLDTCTSSTGTIETGPIPHPYDLGLEFRDIFSPRDVSSLVAKGKGLLTFEDSLVICRFNTRPATAILCQVVNAATGWNFTTEDAMEMGRRVVNLLRVFNFKHGLTAEMEFPSARYSSVPVDGPHRGRDVMSVWDEMRRNYYELLGWDRDSGKPLPDTLRRLGLEHIVKDIWG